MEKYQANINNGAYVYSFDSFSNTGFSVTLESLESTDSLCIDIIGIKIKGLHEKLKVFLENYLSNNDFEKLRLYMKTSPNICIDDVSFNFSLPDIKIYRWDDNEL